MPISYLFKGDLLMFKARGAVTVKEFYLAWNKASGDPSFQRPIDALIDLREAQVDVPGQEIEDIVTHDLPAGFPTLAVGDMITGPWASAFGKTEKSGVPPERQFFFIHSLVGLYNFKVSATLGGSAIAATASSFADTDLLIHDFRMPCYQAIFWRCFQKRVKRGVIRVIIYLGVLKAQSAQ